VIGKDGDRDEVCDKFEAALRCNPALLQKVKAELKARTLCAFANPNDAMGIRYCELPMKMATNNIKRRLPQELESETGGFRPGPKASLPKPWMRYLSVEVRRSCSSTPHTPRIYQRRANCLTRKCAQVFRNRCYEDSGNPANPGNNNACGW